jgi:chaperonin GroES
VSLQPLRDIVLLEPEPIPEKLGSLYVPAAHQYLSHRGKVVAVGPGAHDQQGRFVPTTLQPGDDVLYSPTAGSEFRIDGRKMVMAHERDILVVLHDVPAGVVFIG